MSNFGLVAKFHILAHFAIHKVILVLFKSVPFLNCYCGEISELIPSYLSRCRNFIPINSGWINARTLQQS